MQHGKNTRRIIALERRKLDVKFYNELLLEPLPQKLFGMTFKFGENKKWKKFLNDKINKAEKEVKKLEERIE